MTYRHRITGIRWDDPERKRRVAYDPWPGYVLPEHGARGALWNMRSGESRGTWAGWTDLRIERRPADLGWEVLEESVNRG